MPGGSPASGEFQLSPSRSGPLSAAVLTQQPESLNGLPEDVGKFGGSRLFIGQFHLRLFLWVRLYVVPIVLGGACSSVTPRPVFVFSSVN